MTTQIFVVLVCLLSNMPTVRGGLDFDYDFTEINAQNQVVNKQDSNGDVITLSPLPGTGSDNPILSTSPEGIYFSGNAGAYTDCDDSSIGTANGFAAWVFPMTQTSSNPFIAGFVRNSKKTATLEMNNSFQLVYRGTQIGGQTTKTHNADSKILRVNHWNLIGVRIDGATYVKTYINDGTLSIDSQWLSVPYQTAAPLRLVLGSNPFQHSPGNFFRGYIRSFKAWTVTNPGESSITSLVSTSCGVGCTLCGTTQSWCTYNEKWLDLNFQSVSSFQVPDSSSYSRLANFGNSAAFQDTGVQPLFVGKQGVYFFQQPNVVTVDTVPFTQSTFSFDVWFRFDCSSPISGEASLFQKNYLASNPSIPGFSVRVTTDALNLYLMSETPGSVSYTFVCTEWHNILLFVRKSSDLSTDIDISINNDHSSTITIPQVFDESAIDGPKGVIGGAGFTGFIAFLQITNYYRSPYSSITDCNGVVCPLRTGQALPVCTTSQYYDISSSTCKPCHSDCPLCVGGLAQECIHCQGYTQLTPTPVGACLPLECDGRCDTCTGPYNSDCVSCLVGVPDGQGLCHCDWDQEYSQLTNQCVSKAQPCFQSTCSTCSGPLQQDCTSCISNYFLLTDTFECVANECPTGYFTDLGAQECNPGTCDDRCSSCSGPLLSDCLQCTGPEIDGLCSCPSGTYFNSISCEICTSNCQNCLDQTSCEVCETEYLQKGGSCYVDSSTLCPSSQFYDPTTSSCQSKSVFTLACDQTCLTCYTSSPESCLSCPKGKVLSISDTSQECLDCVAFPGLYYDESINSQECIEVCGDGIILYSQECDDGGGISEDGCSSDCIVQEGYSCSGQPSICVDIKDPYIIRVTHIDEKTVEVQFSEPMSFLLDSSFTEEPNNPLFQILLSKNQECLNPYELERVNTFTVKLLLSYRCSIDRAQVSIQTSQSPAVESLLTDLSGNKVQRREAFSESLLTYQHLSLAEISSITNMGMSSCIMTILSLILNILVIWFINGTLESMWGLINLLQMVAYIPLMRLHFPKNIIRMFKIFLFFNGNIQILQDLLQTYVLNSEELDPTPFTPRFEEYGFESTSFFLNSGVQLSVWLLYLLLLPLFMLFSCICPRIKCCKNALKSYGYNGIIRGLVQGFLDLTVSISLNLVVYKTENLWQQFSFIFAIIFFVLLILFIFIVVYVLTRDPSEFEKKEHQDQFGMLYENIKLSTTSNSGILFKGFFYCYFLIRRCLFGFSLVLLEPFPTVQMIVNISISLIFCVWVLMAKPFKTKPQNFLLCLNEVCFMFVISLCTAYIDESRPLNLALSLGWLIIAIVVGCVLANCIITFLIQVKVIKEKCKEKKKRKRRKSVQALEFVHPNNTTQQGIFRPEHSKEQKIVIGRSFTRTFKQLDFYGTPLHKSFTSVRGSL